MVSKVQSWYPLMTHVKLRAHLAILKTTLVRKVVDSQLIFAFVWVLNELYCSIEIEQVGLTGFIPQIWKSSSRFDYKK